MSRSNLVRPLLLAGLAVLPGTTLRFLPVEPSAPLVALLSGSAVLAAAVLLLWACEALQEDISRSAALTIVALVAVLPEYAVDMYFTWQAGRNPEGGYASYAIANMTGANRLLIGVGWPLIAFLVWFTRRRPALLEPDQRLELWFLGAATLYGFIVALKGSLTIFDGAVLVALYVAYVLVVMRKPAGHPELMGVAARLADLPDRTRKATVAGILIYAAGAVLANAEPFCEALIHTGKTLGVDEFLLVQWLAPLASESPELILAAVFALRGRDATGLGSLVSSKLNQWTLLVGTIPVVYAISAATVAHPIPLGAFQLNEILLTAAQSLFGICVLVSLRFSIWGALALLVLFLGQLVGPVVHAAQLGQPLEHDLEQAWHHAFVFAYVAASALWICGLAVRGLRRRAVARKGEAEEPGAEAPPQSAGE